MKKIFTLALTVFLLNSEVYSALIQGENTEHTLFIKERMLQDQSGSVLSRTITKGDRYPKFLQGFFSPEETFQAAYSIVINQVSAERPIDSKRFSAVLAHSQLVGNHGFHPAGVSIEFFRQTVLGHLNTIWDNREGTWKPGLLKTPPFNIGNAKKYMGHTALWLAVLNFDPFHKGFVTDANRDLDTAWGFLNDAEAYVTTKSLFLLKAAALVEGVAHGWNPYLTPQERDDNIEGFLEAFEAGHQGGQGRGDHRAHNPPTHGLVHAKPRLVDGDIHARIQAYLDQLQQAGLGGGGGGGPPPPPPPAPHHGGGAHPSPDGGDGATFDEDLPGGHVGSYDRDLAEESEEEVFAPRRKGKGRRIVESSEEEEEEDLRASAKKRAAEFSKQEKEKRRRSVESSEEEEEEEEEERRTTSPQKSRTREETRKLKELIIELYKKQQKEKGKPDIKEISAGVFERCGIRVTSNYISAKVITPAVKAGLIKSTLVRLSKRTMEHLERYIRENIDQSDEQIAEEFDKLTSEGHINVDRIRATRLKLKLVRRPCPLSPAEKKKLTSLLERYPEDTNKGMAERFNAHVADGDRKISFQQVSFLKRSLGLSEKKGSPKRVVITEQLRKK